MNEELKKLIDQLKSLRVPTAQVDAMANAVRNAREGTQEHNAALENMRARVQAVTEAADFAGESFSNLTAILRENLKELSGKEDSQKRLIKSTKGIVDLSQQLTYHEEEITDYSEKQLAKKIETAKQNKKLMSQAAEEQIRSLSHLGLQANMGNQAYHAKVNELLTQGKITKEQANTFREYKKGFPIVQAVIDKGEAQLTTQKHVNETLGITGGLIKGLSGVMGKLGIEGSAFQHGIESANVAMKKAAKDGAGKLKTALIGVSEVTKGVVSQLNDPIFIGGVIVKFGLEGADHITEMQRSLGQSVESGKAMVSKLEEFATESGNAFITTAKLGHAVAGLSAEAGTFATKFDKKNLIGFVELTENLGYATEQASHLITTLEMHDQTMNDFESNIEKSVNGFNKATNSNITLKAVMDDILSASQALHVTIGQTPNALVDASIAARGLGTTLKGVENIADSLLDFNQSIDAEMEAQLMTGKSLNLARAREFALMGNMEKVAEEIGNQQAVQEAFATNNVLAQRSVAKALGMSREELADMYKQQQLQVLSQKEGLTAQEQQTMAALKARKASEQMADVVGKIKDQFAQAFLPLGEVILKIMEKVSVAFANPVFGSFITKFALIGTGAIIAGKSLLGVVKGVKGLSKNFKELQSLGKSAMGFFSKMFGTASEAAEQTASVVSNTASQASQGVSEMREPKTSGSKVKEFLTNLAAGLKEMGSMKVLGGALNLIPASIGFIAFIPGMVGAKLMEKLNGEKLQENLYGLAMGLEEMGSMKVLGGALNLIPASLGFIAFIPGMIGAKLMEKLDGEKLQENLYGLAMGLEEMGKGKVILGTGALLLSAVGFTAMIPATAGMALFNLVAPTTNKLLPKFGSALAQFGALMMTGVALLGLAALGVAAIALGYALKLAAPAIESAGTAIGAILTGLTPIVKVVGETIIGVFKSIPGIITAVADGFVNMFSAISMDNIVPILLLGPALLGASIGIAAFAAALTGGSILSGISSLMGGGIMSDLESLAAMSEPLATVGVSLTAIAAGIAALSSALATLELEKIDELKDLVMTTAFAAPAIAATGAITELISGITGASSGGDSDKALLEKIDRLIAAVETGGDVYIDGNKAGRAINIATYKSA